MQSLEEVLERVALEAVETYKAQLSAQSRERSRRWREANPEYKRNPDRLPPEDVARICELAALDLTQAEIAAQVGWSRPTVGRVERHYGVSHKPQGGQRGNTAGPKKLAPDPLVKLMREEGMTHREIALVLHVSQSSVVNRLRVLDMVKSRGKRK